MIQIENEIGMLEDARDYSKAAQKEYEKGVPDQLMSHLRKIAPPCTRHCLNAGSRMVKRLREAGVKYSATTYTATNISWHGTMLVTFNAWPKQPVSPSTGPYM